MAKSKLVPPPNQQMTNSNSVDKEDSYWHNPNGNLLF